MMKIEGYNVLIYFGYVMMKARHITYKRVTNLPGFGGVGYNCVGLRTYTHTRLFG